MLALNLIKRCASRFALALVSVCGCAQIASAQYGSTVFYDQNMVHVVSVTGYTEAGKLISGTNENIGLQTATGIDILWPIQIYNSFQVIEAKLEFSGGGPTEVVPVISAPLAYGVNLTKGARYASTHFADQSNLTITLKVKIKSLKIEGQAVVLQGPVIEYATAVVPKVHNKLFAWSTTHQVLPFSVFECQTAKDKIAHSSVDPRHGFLGAPTPNFRADVSEIGVGLKQATFVHVSAHGDMNGISDSFNEHIPWSDYLYTITNQRIAPEPNIVITYSCSSLASPPDAPLAFRIMEMVNGEAVSRVNRAYAGFSTIVYSGPFSRTDVHAQEVYKQLANGLTLQEAVNSANDLTQLYRNVDDPPMPAVMEVTGDPNAQIVGIYRIGLPSLPNSLSSWIHVY